MLSAACGVWVAIQNMQQTLQAQPLMKLQPGKQFEKISDRKQFGKRSHTVRKGNWGDRQCLRQWSRGVQTFVKEGQILYCGAARGFNCWYYVSQTHLTRTSGKTRLGLRIKVPFRAGANSDIFYSYIQQLTVIYKHTVIWQILNLTIVFIFQKAM